MSNQSLPARQDTRLAYHRARVLRRFALLGLLLSSFVLNGCWATWSELKKERRLREALDQQFRAFKRKQRASQREQAKKIDKILAKQGAIIAQLRAKVQSIANTVKEIEKRVKQGQGGVIEMFATLEKLQRNFQASLGQVQELQKQIQELLKKLPERDKKLQEIRQKYEKLLKNTQLLAEQAIPAKLFARGEDALKKNDFANAMRLFKTFTQRFGSHDLADNAHKYIGDIHRKQKRRNAAILAYLDVIQKHPQGNAVPAALVWLGRLHYRKGACRSGRKYFRRLMNYRRHAPALARIGRSSYRNWRSQCVGARRRKRRRKRRRRRRRR